MCMGQVWVQGGQYRQPRPPRGWECVAQWRRCVTPKLLLIELRRCVGPGSGVRDAATCHILIQRFCLLLLHHLLHTRHVSRHCEVVRMCAVCSGAAARGFAAIGGGHHRVSDVTQRLELLKLLLGRCRLNRLRYRQPRLLRTQQRHRRSLRRLRLRFRRRCLSCLACGFTEGATINITFCTSEAWGCVLSALASAAPSAYGS